MTLQVTVVDLLFHNIDVNVNPLISNVNKYILPYLRIFVNNRFFTAPAFISGNTGLWFQTA